MVFDIVEGQDDYLDDIDWTHKITVLDSRAYRKSKVGNPSPLQAHSSQMSDGRAHPSSATAKKVVKRAARPAPLTRKFTTGSLSRGDITPRASPVGLDETLEGLERLEMAASFLQYCANCEKQIMHPSHSVLYCSAACRRKDTKKPLSFDESTISPQSSAPSSPRPILAPRTPTGSGYTDYPSIRIPADLHNAKSDLDPTEWKPKLSRSRNSEAYRYLSQFHRSSAAGIEVGEKGDTRPYLHSSTASMTSMTTPSLSPATTATSSFSEYSYDFSTRPLPPRQNPMYSTSAGTSKGIDLVTPHIVPQFVGSVPATGNWEKKTVVKGTTAAKDGLLSKSMGK